MKKQNFLLEKLFQHKNRFRDLWNPTKNRNLETKLQNFQKCCKIFSNLKKDGIKDNVASYFGVRNVDLLANWMFCISILRNTCAHHARVWNRRLPAITISKKTSYCYLNNKNIYSNKLYSYISIIEYLLNIISPEHGFKNNFRQLIATCPLFQEREMGFPTNWRDEDFWK